MIKRKHFLSKIRSLGFAFKKRQKRTELYRRRGATDYIHLPRSAFLDRDFVIPTLRFSGLSQSTIDWERDATGFSRQDTDLAHGRIEERSIRVLTPVRGFLNYPHVAQVVRVTRRRTDARQNGNRKKTSREYAYGITSAPASRATPEQLLAYNRGHWAVEVNHLVRDKTFGEDACLARTRFAPANNATCTNLALAIIIHQTSFKNFASATRHFALQHKDALTALLSP